MYQPLYVKTTYSLLSSLVSISDIVCFCKKNRMSYVAITDSNLFGAIEFLKECEKQGIHGIIGLEIFLDEKPVLLYAKDYLGYQRLMKLSTIQSERVITKEELLMDLSHLIVILPFISHDYYSLFPDHSDIYLGYTNREEEKICYLFTKNVAFLPEVLYLEEKEKEYLSYLWMIRDGKTIADEPKLISGLHHIPITMLDQYSDSEGLMNSTKILEKCHLEFPKAELLLPIYQTEAGLTSDQYLFELSKKGLWKRLNGEVSNPYKERLTYELSVIQKMGFSNYFLVVYDFIRYAKKNGILVGPGRGSGAGSLVAYSLGITEIDPLKYQLLFERFLNPERITMPDIDTDFPDVYRDQVIDYVVSKYGKKRVAGIVTFGTLGAKQAIRDVSRVLNIPLYKVDQLCKFIPTMTKQNLSDFFREDEKFRSMIEDDDTLLRMYHIASRIEGFPRHTSSHAAGIVMCEKDLDEVVPLIKSDQMYLTAYSMEYLESFGLLKMDFLGLKNLTTIMNILNDIKEGEGISIDFNQISLNDSETLSIFSTANTSGIFQFESTGMRNFLRQLKPDRIEDIFAAIALFRPGPAVNIDSYVKRRHGVEEVHYLDSCLKDILEPTYGIIIYQEQIMQIASRIAGYTLGEADILRRAMSKKKMDVLQGEETKFLKQSMERGFSYETAKKIFDLILNFANYGFNRAHSVAYSFIAYKMAYLKVHYPKYFFANLFTGVIGSETKTKEYWHEAKLNHLKLLKPDINFSRERYFVEKEGIRYPLSNIRNVGVQASHDILEARKTPFVDIFDFLARANSRSITRKTIESLIDASCFDLFGYNHATLFHNMDAILNYADLAKDLDPEFILKPEIVCVPEFSKEKLMLREKEVFGFYFSNHPATTKRLNYSNAITIEKVPSYFNRTIQVIGLIDNIKTINTKKGDKMAFLVCSDETGSMDFTLFPKVYLNYFGLEKGNLVLLTGVVEKRLNQYQIIVREITKL